MPRVRIIEVHNEEEARGLLAEIGASKPGQRLMAPKAIHRVIRVSGLGAVALNILKQEMLTAGGDAGIPANAYYLKDKTGEALLMGTRSQYARLIRKLQMQPGPLGLGSLADEIEAALQRYDQPPALWSVRGRSLDLNRPPYLIGTINVTLAAAVDASARERLAATAAALAGQGVEIIELYVGPNADLHANARDGLARAVDAVAQSAECAVALATTEPTLAAAGLEAGAAIIDDIAVGCGSDLAAVAAETQAGLIVHPTEGRPVPELIDSLADRIAHAEVAGVGHNRIAVDPAPAHGAPLPVDILLRRLAEFRILGVPIVLTIPVGTDGGGASLTSDVQAAIVGARAALATAAGANALRVSIVPAAAAAVKAIR